MSAELKPCPFCGSTNIDPEGWMSADDTGPACDDCKGSADSIEEWNRRPREAELREQYVEALVSVEVARDLAVRLEQRIAQLQWLIDNGESAFGSLWREATAGDIAALGKP